MCNGIRVLLFNDNLMLKNGSNDEKRNYWYLNSNKHCNVKLLWQIKGSVLLPKKDQPHLHCHTFVVYPLVLPQLTGKAKRGMTVLLTAPEQNAQAHACLKSLVCPWLQEQCFNAHATRTKMHSTTSWVTLTQLHNRAMRTCPARILSCATHQTRAQQSLATHKCSPFF